MATFKVCYEIDIEDVDTSEDAAQKAWETMRRGDSIANVFLVFDELGNSVYVDLYENEHGHKP